MDAILKGLNAAQSAAVTSTAPVLQVLAPPGSGKTKTLTARVAYLLAHHGYQPWNVICCTFTIKASREMRTRLKSLIGERLESKLLLGTFHSICRRYLANYGYLIGIPKGFQIADSSDSLAILTRVIKRLNVSLEPRSTRTRISRCKAKAQNVDEHLQQPPRKKASADEQEFLQVYEEYQNALAASNLLDYDDLLIRCADLLRARPECVGNVEAVLIDEFQDTNTVQLELMKLLAGKNRRVTIVGDPDQSIYGFRSAEIQNLTRMQRYYPDTSVIHLEENYRSSAAVLCCAQEVIEQDTVRPNKRLKATHCYGTFPVLRRLPSAHDEAKWIVAEIKRMKAMTGNLTTFSDYAILIRSAHLSLLIENALGKAGMPYRMVGGYRFFDRDEIRTLLDYLRTISQPNNNAALSAIINVPSRKIGEESLKELLRLADESGTSLWSVIQKYTQGDLTMKKKLSRPAEQNLCKLIALVKEAKKRMVNVTAESTAKFLLEFCLNKLSYKEYLQGKHAGDHENRWANVEELLNQANDIAESGSNRNGVDSEESLPEIEGLDKQQSDSNDEALATFLANITLSSDLQATEDNQEQECITISTIHSAKGLEWPIVFIPAVYEGSIPHSRAEDTDEERRLLYVAMTRAQALLYLTCPLRQSRSDTETTLSSFLPLKLHRHFVQIGPVVTDKVVRDIALILRRSPPSEEELLKGLKSLSERESSGDNLWPADGSAKPKQWWDFEDEATSTRHKVDLNTDRQHNIHSNRMHYSDLKAGTTMTETTMTGSSSFSLAGISVGFSTAARHLELTQTQVQDEMICREREITTSKRTTVAKSRRGKTKASGGQGSLANFFAHGSFGSTTERPASKPLPEPELPSYINAPLKQEDHNIPTVFTSHKLSTKPASLKRPQPLAEIPNGKRKPYGFLSSSPSREVPPDQSFKGSCGGDTNRATGPESILSSTSKSTTTMHTTSVDMLRLQSAPGRRKTYGVRRMMNGWENRKNH
ncbi:hypothetical protein EPUS_00613 [Endocarpon pusillum Z07020]|uniref:DNA 3'-5' helicase n=1 Tax=Endocarpon pusillum (strain Z07020 / HMAS-L-300199) TaxID=1263415 RepID=U1HRA3_ENDPU|nr:uncharacterized protein EPUS_00613 [Endocarpon pusillum Z07020]ERF71624.1 hypothetical protein EPUS_00613 [Endocarpon pusillum Z07020]